MSRLVRFVLALALAAPLGAQQSKDSILATRIKVDCAATDRDRSAPKYSKEAIVRCKARADSIVALHVSPVTPPPNQPPVARIASACANATLSCSFNGSASTDDKGVTSYSWDFGDGATAIGVATTHPYASAGSRTVRLRVTDAAGLSDDTTAVVTLTAAQPPPDTVIVEDSTQTGTDPAACAPAACPASVPKFTIPAPTRVTRVAPPMDLQSALNSARPGDELRLSGMYTGEFRVPVVCDASQWITIRSDVADAVLPPPGTRMTPSKAAAAGLAKIVAPTTYPGAALAIRGATCHVRLLGLEIAYAPTSAVLNYGLVTLGESSDLQTSLSQVPRDLLLDRVYVHGSATGELRRCVSLQSANTAIVNSWLSDCHASGSDAQTIAGWNGPGPYLIENNYLEGSGENVMFGGGDPGILNLVPSDITIRRNHLAKPLAWKGKWSVKNLLELKNARRTLIEQNVAEHTWQASQAGMGFVIKSSGDANAANARWQGTQDVTIRWNVIRSMHRGIDFQAVDCSGQPCVDVHTARVLLEQNLFDSVGVANGIPAQSGWLTFWSGDLKDITLQRNTWVGNAPGFGFAMSMAVAAPGEMQRIRVLDNIFGGQFGAPSSEGYAIRADGAPGIGTKALNYVAGTSWTFTGNIVSRVTPEWVSAHPPNNTYLDAITKIGFTPAGASTVYPTKGVDIAELTRRTLGVVVAP